MDATMNDLQRAAARARPALAVLSAGLGEPSPDMAQALAIIEQMSGARTAVDEPFAQLREDTLADYQLLLPHQDQVIRQAEALVARLR